MKKEFDIARIVIVRRGGHTDKISFILAEETAKTVHPGRYWDIFQGASLEMEVTYGRGESVVKALLGDVPVEVLNV